MVAEIADRVAVMQAGRVVELGATGQVLAQPRHDYTRHADRRGAEPRARASGRVPPRPRPCCAPRSSPRSTGAAGSAPAARCAPPTRVSIAVRRGETLGLVGESGSGKSTVARCIARLIDPSAGEIFLDEQPIGRLGRRRLRPYRRRVQIVFQDPYRSLNPRRTVGASILEGPMNYGLPRAEALARARSLMALVNLDPEALGRFPHQFSGGQRQRICIARALAMEPELLIADEAVSALDVSVQAQVLELLDDVRKRLELAMLFITHDLRVAAQVCDTVAVMHQGRVVE